MMKVGQPADWRRSQLAVKLWTNGDGHLGVSETGHLYIYIYYIYIYIYIYMDLA